MSMDMSCRSRKRTLEPTAVWPRRRVRSGANMARWNIESVPAMISRPSSEFSWIVFKSRTHRDRVNAKVMKDPRIMAMGNPEAMPFDVKRMAYGGFNILVGA